ncbi:hypothetical protein BCR34DRAFT_8424 [Clohesyomyces aquaticus]|uniref:Secreted protein n=1 Tax=Clohesyomyces aquaticus TaxID=1231657 RepID=A0A1Y2A5L3_9PLEO|nr:hypothetical protein BCR34DRAFT_8424 [Clohesyomyces aquaticus]
MRLCLCRWVAVTPRQGWLSTLVALHFLRQLLFGQEQEAGLVAVVASPSASVQFVAAALLHCLRPRHRKLLNPGAGPTSQAVPMVGWSPAGDSSHVRVSRTNECGRARRG